jgi:hypothetical protein
VVHLDERLDPGLAGRALGDHEDTDCLDCAVPRLGAAGRSATQCGPGGFDGVEGIGLAGPTPLLSIRSIDFDDLDSRPAQMASQP